MTCEITGICRGVGSFTVGRGQAHHERIEREGGVDVEVAEENLLRARRANPGGCLPNLFGSTSDLSGLAGLTNDLSGALMATEKAASGEVEAKQKKKSKRGEGEADLPSHCRFLLVFFSSRASLTWLT